MWRRMVYEMFFLGRNFMFGLLCTLEPKKPLKNFFQKTYVFQPCCMLLMPVELISVCSEPFRYNYAVILM